MAATGRTCASTATRPSTAATCSPTISSRSRTEISGHDQAVPDREADEIGGVVQLELLQDVLAVRIDRADADVEQRSHFLVRLAFGDQLQHLPLAVGEQAQVGITVERRGGHHVLAEL